MTDLNQIIRELAKSCENDEDDPNIQWSIGYGEGVGSAITKLDALVQELKNELENAMHSRPLRPVTAEVLRRVIGEEPND